MASILALENVWYGPILGEKYRNYYYFVNFIRLWLRKKFEIYTAVKQVNFGQIRIPYLIWKSMRAYI